MDRALTGRLLVASPTLLDPNFARSVVLLLEHNDEGSLGIVLNRPSDTPVGDVLEGWHESTAPPGVVFVGGPVQPEVAVGLARVVDAEALGDGFESLFGEVGSIDLARDATVVTPALADLRIFSGYSGWDAGQLENELEGDDWLVVDALPDDVFVSDPSGLWRAVLRRQRDAELRILADFPLLPSMN